VRRAYTRSFAAEARFCRQERAMRLAKNRRTGKRVRSPDEAIVREGGLAKPQPSRTGEKCVSVYLSPEKWRELKILAVTTDTTIDALMRRAAELVLAEHNSKLPKRPSSKRSGGKGANGSARSAPDDKLGAVPRCTSASRAASASFRSGHQEGHPVREPTEGRGDGSK
jgi:hypothetical protein